MPEQSTILDLPSPGATAMIAATIAPRLRPGDTILLEGQVGAGKTHFARCLIQSILQEPEDVPSPTFTLVQTYDTTAGPLWHADLYRVGSVHEIEELGLSDAFDNAICLVEWPDRLGPLRPAAALMLEFGEGPGEDARRLTVRWTAARWSETLAPWGQHVA
jgi:tRNA threonylcarbamoyladenosine biosynthesis protein TsaE